MKVLRPAALLAIAGLAIAHPMGNLSVNHYARLEPTTKGVNVTYVLDLAELPTFELMQSWNVPRDAGKDVLEAKAKTQAAEWVSNLSFTEAGEPLSTKVLSSGLTVLDGAGNLPVFRIETKLFVPATGGRFEYADQNYATRAGWREIVISPGPGADVSKASNGDTDISRALTSYPQDPTKAPPQNTKAWLEWTPLPETVSQTKKPVIVAQSAAPPPANLQPAVPEARDSRPPEPQSLGTVKRDDAISRILRRGTLSGPILLTLLALAFWFGALHALEPGHGKTMVAAYLVGSRGTPKHAALLGATVTFTHTISVFILGLATMFLSRYVMADRISKVLGIVSGLSIVWIGAMLLWKRSRGLAHSHAHAAHTHTHTHTHTHDHDHHHPHTHSHDHSHEHEHAHVHDQQHAHLHEHSHDHGHQHDHGHGHTHDHDHHHHPHEHPHHHDGPLTHTHDGHTHTHVPPSDISVGSLLALGASGGLVPCPSALILLLSAISIGRVGLGMVLLLAFSLGLAIVLTATGMLVLYARNLLPEHKRTDNAFFRYMPVISAAAILLIGVLMTGVSLGWVPASRFIG
jgi:ABC-type nickel/cobalt efflux system permease component RcnA